MRTRSRILVVLGSALLVAGAAALGLVVYARRSLPVVEGTRTAVGIDAALDIVRDVDGVPHVRAQSERDAYFGLGYLHAQDRLWQLELQRRAGSGRLSEVFGAQTLPDDRLLRALGLRRAAEAGAQVLDARTAALAQAYADGINAHLREGRTLPPEFLLLGVRPEPWTPADSLVVQKLTAWALTGQFQRELLRVRLIQTLGAVRAAEVIAGVPDDLSALEPLLGDLAQAAGALASHLAPGRPSAVGSNGWAVTGARTASGRPLLANDPHMDLSAPSLWYLAHLEAPDLTVVGATLPGLPGVILGHNGKVAWGFTNARIDALDFYVERLSADGTAYEHEHGGARFAVIEERIAVRDAPTELLRVRVGRHGPVVSDVSAEARRAMPAGHALAARFAAVEPGDLTLRFPMRAAHARDASALIEAARDLHSPPQNVVAADVEGHIAFVAAGRVPARAEDDPLRGRVPMPGWLARHDWQGFLPFEALPQRRDPPEGRIVTANQDLRGPGYPHAIGSDWDAPHRADRITHLLGARAGHDVDSQARIQLDVQSAWAERLLPAMLAMLTDAAHAAPRARLARWSRALDGGSREAALFAAWLRELGRAVYGDELARDLAALWGETPNLLPRVLADDDGLARWCDDRATQDVEPCAVVVRRAFARALATVDADARWDAVHQARFTHTPLGAVPGVGALFDVVVPAPGGAETVNLAEYAVDDEAAPFESHVGAGFRALYDLADLARSRFIVAPGQSGNVLSPHYRDLTERWANGSYLPARTLRTDVDAHAAATLTLLPATTSR
ncbi:MAG: penicillin acylase family protein [Polyangiales bacterium]